MVKTCRASVDAELAFYFLKELFMATKPIKTWVDTLFELQPDEQLIIRKTPTFLNCISITYKRSLNRDWFRQAEIVMSMEDIQRYGKSYVIKNVNKMLEDTRN